MNIVKNMQFVARPRWDGHRVLFEMEIGGRLVPCAISRGALEELSGCRHIAPGDLLRRFAKGRDRIEAIAARIFAIRPENVTGTLHVWADDIDDPSSTPAATALQAEGRA